MVFDMGSVFIYIVGIFLLYLCCRLFLKPIKWLLKLVLSCGIGAAAIAVFNYFASFMDLHLAINPLTAMITGILGIPGMIMMLVLRSF